MADWPVSLPQIPLQSGFSMELPRTVIATEMDAGPKKYRRRYTAGVTKYKVEFVFTATELSTFQTFFNTTTLGGSLAFNFDDPITGDSGSFRFDIAEASPSISSEDVFFRVSFGLEKLP